jgi:hypothetical protein
MEAPFGRVKVSEAAPYRAEPRPLDLCGEELLVYPRRLQHGPVAVPPFAAYEMGDAGGRDDYQRGVHQVVATH